MDVNIFALLCALIFEYKAKHCGHFCHFLVWYRNAIDVQAVPQSIMIVNKQESRFQTKFHKLF